MRPVVGRFAPSPTGRMHLGNAFAALGAWLGARAGAVHAQGSADLAQDEPPRSATSRFLLRIEDIDTPRAVPDADRWIMDDLSWLGIDWDGDPVYQSQRTEIYEQVLRRLGEQRLDENEWLTYPCYCTRAQLRAASAPQESDGFLVYPGTCRHFAAATIESDHHGDLLAAGGEQKPQNSPSDELTENSHSPRVDDRFPAREGRNPAVRMAMPPQNDPRAKVEFCDELFGNQPWNLPLDLGDIVLRRSDGLFAYQLAVVVDDYLQGVTQVVRGRDLLRSTAAQLWVRKWVGKVCGTVADGGASVNVAVSSSAAVPPAAPHRLEFAHLPLLLSDTTHTRLAKRDHSLELSTLRERGVTPERIVGYLGYLLGILKKPDPCTPAELLPEFSWGKIRAAGLADRKTDPSILAQ